MEQLQVSQMGLGKVNQQVLQPQQVKPISVILAIDVTLPSPTIGDTIRFLDATGTFDTNDLTILVGSSKIQGVAANLDVATERAGFSIVYYNATQGWLLTDV